MNINATFEKLSILRMHGFERAYREITQSYRQEKFTLDELIAHLIDAEYDERHNKKITGLLKQAKLRQQASFEQIDFQQPRGLDKTLALRLLTCDWIKKSRDLLVTGPTGVGKSFVACAFGHQACQNQFKGRHSANPVQ